MEANYTKSESSSSKAVLASEKKKSASFSGKLPESVPPSVFDNLHRNVTTRRGGNARSSYTWTAIDDVDGQREFPMFIAMANLCFTPTGFTDTVLKETLLSKILVMSGDILLPYTNRTTHLLAAHANTTKVELARERNLPVVSIEWVESIWNACQQNPYIHASLPQFQNYELPLFYNLHFAFSLRYDMDTKQLYERLLLANGGCVGNRLNHAINYFYICQEPELDRLYEYAQAAKIPCLPLAWIMESIHRKSLAKITEFEIRGKAFQELGTTFEMRNPENRQHVPIPNYPDSTQTSKMKELVTCESVIDDSRSPSIPNGDGDGTHSTTLIAESNDMEDDIGKENGSCLEETLIVVDNSSKDKDSLAFSMAG